MSFPYADSTILVTGATGHTGRRLVQHLLSRGAHVRCFVHNPAHGNRLPHGEGLEIVQGSADSAEDLERAAEGVQAVLHLAHIRYSPYVVEALSKKTYPVRVIATSSTRLMSTFRTPLREVVREGEAAFHSAPPNVQWTILRPAMIFGGPDDNNLEKMAKMLKRLPVFPLFGWGDNLVQPIFVWDLIAAIEACLDHPEVAGHTYVVAGPEAITYREMVETVAEAAGLKRPRFVYLPRRTCTFIAQLVRLFWKKSPVDPDAIRRFGEDRAFAIHPAQRDLGFAPIPFREALEKKFKREV